MENKTGGEFQLVGENLLLVHAPIAIRVGENADAVEGFAVVFARLDGARVLPDIGIGLAEAVGIFRGFDNPHAAFPVPIKVHRLVDQRFGGHQRNIELGMHLDLRGSFLRAGGSADGVTQFFIKAFLLR